MQSKELKFCGVFSGAGWPLLGTEGSFEREECRVANCTDFRIKLSGFKFWSPPKSCVTSVEFLNFSVPEFPNQ